MKKPVWIILFCLCLLLTAGALAEESRLTCPDLQPTQVNPSVPAGSFTLDSSNHLYLNIDSKATDWDKLITLAGLPADNLTLRFFLAVPEGADRYTVDGSVDTYFDPDWFSSYDSCDPLYNDSKIGVRIPYARYLRDTETLTFTPEPNLAMVAIRWYKADQSVLMDEYYYIHLPGGSVRVHPDYPSSIVPEKGDGLQNQLSRSGVKYRLSKGTFSQLTTRVKAPSGAAQFDAGDGMQSVQNGYAALVSDATGTNTRHYAITWYDQSGNPLRIEAMYITVSVYSSKPAVAERDDLNPLITGENGWMGINAVARQIMEAQVDYKGVNGWMNIRMQGGPRLVWDDLEESRYVLRLKVPEDAVSLFVTELPEDIYTPLEDQQIQGMMQELSHAPDEAEPVSGPEYLYQEGLLKNMTPDDPRIAVYAPYLPQDEDYGMVRLFFWYDANGDLTSLYWTVVTTSDVGTFVTHPFRKEGDIHDKVEQPCFVDGRHDDWQLESHYNPQSGNNAYQVELTLLDGDGLEMQPDGTTVFYLPYPEGMSYQQGATWTLRHYLDDDYENYENITVIATEYGLRFESSSLSPFVLLWEGGAEPLPAVVPKTGDSSPLALYVVLAVLSAALMGVMVVRRKKA